MRILMIQPNSHSGGAEAYCYKQASVEQLADAVRQAVAGEIYVDPPLRLAPVSH
jgi:DNA-binding NarL/FixJ family response regulator